VRVFIQTTTISRFDSRSTLSMNRLPTLCRQEARCRNRTRPTKRLPNGRPGQSQGRIADPSCWRGIHWLLCHKEWVWCDFHL